MAKATNPRTYTVKKKDGDEKNLKVFVVFRYPDGRESWTFNSDLTEEQLLYTFRESQNKGRECKLWYNVWQNKPKPGDGAEGGSTEEAADDSPF